MSDILLISSGIVHPPLLGRVYLWRALRATPGIRLRGLGTVEALRRIDLAATRAVVLYLHRQTISPQALEALDRFARAGGGILALHSATASFKESPRYFEILGGRFLWHPPIGPLEVRPIGGPDEVFGAIPPFAITDEAYRHELSTDIRVHFVARLARAESASPHRVGRDSRPGPGEGEDAAGEIPFVWTRQHGAGRVCYVTAGHCASSMRHPAVVQILRRGLAWVCRADEEVGR